MHCGLQSHREAIVYQGLHRYKVDTDINSLRLLCTYSGPGTLWLPNEIVNHKALITRGGNKQIVLDERQIQQVATGAVIILKGALFPQANPIVHR
ncbi:MAG: DUF1826 domain-containing protein, partial [Bacteroidota bacterium]